MGVKRSLFYYLWGVGKIFLKFFLDNDDNNGILGDMSMRQLTTYRIHSAHDWRGVEQTGDLLDLCVVMPEVDTSTPEGRIEEQNNLCEELTNHLACIIVRCEAEQLN